MEFLIDRENQKLLVKLTKLADLKHELFMHIMCTYRKKPANDDIDEELRPLLKSMWEDGYKTLACCSGHGDAGYIVYRPYRCKRWRVIAWPPEVKIPQSVEDLANSKDFIIREFFIEIKMPLGELEKIVKHS